MKEGPAVGWDVGGWLGKKQGVAVLNATRREWLGAPSEFRLPREDRSLLWLIRMGWPQAPPNVFEQYSVVLGIDAPLGFPQDFRQLVAGGLGPAECPATEIESRLAYRETDRAVYEAFRKKPLSASFDKLGNNTTVALHHLRRWQGLNVLPFSEDHGGPVAIEVYPALVKSSGWFKSLLPRDLVPSSDAYDASICALLAASLRLGGRDAELPPLVHPPARLSVVREEGWIYYPDPAWQSARAVSPPTRVGAP